jgi:glucan phosphoethanolaminetransferase (alkaline phosphatase superfamily)
MGHACDTIGTEMTSASTVRPRRKPWRVVVRLALSLATGCALALWVFGSMWIAGLKCDEMCSTDDNLESWEWNGQLVFAVLGALVAAVALILGFTSHRRVYRALLALSVTCAVCWYAWITADDFASF